jgi:hypothetical protein
VKGRRLRGALYWATLLLFALHQDFWLAADSRLLLGLPVGLAYHAGYCLAAAGLMGLLVRFAWPAGVEDGEAEEGDR